MRKVEPLKKLPEETTVRKLRFFSSLRTQIALTVFALVAVLLLLINTYVLLSYRDNIISSKISFVESQAALIATQLEDNFISLTDEDEERIAGVVSPFEVANKAYIIIIDEVGNVAYDPMGRLQREDFPLYNLTRALENHKDILYSGFIDGKFTSSAFRPIVSQGLTIGVICFNEEDIDQGILLLEMQSTFLNITIIVAVISVVAITLIVLSVMRRVDSVINAVKSVREGEYSYTIAMRGNDELAILSDEFNRLTERLRETDEVRRRFVADASHELKTPLATIRLLTDSILQNQDIGQETALEFICDINLEAERLARTTEKLMALTRLDSQIKDELSLVNMKNSVKDTVRMLKNLAGSKGISIRTQLEDGCFVLATEDSIHHIVFNLVENAIKYNQPDGNVYIRLEKSEEKVVLSVRDRGIGVPREELPYIFERFYRVDKARSHDSIADGSGLGLAIVRDTVRDLGGNVTAEIRKNGGMIFAVEFELSS